MDTKQKIYSYIAIAFIGALVLVTINRYYQESKIDLVLPDNYFVEQNDTTEKIIDTEYSNLAVLKDIPLYTSNSFFEYRILTKYISPPHLNIYLTPLFTNQDQFENNYQQTKSEIFNWIVSRGTIISDLEINFYLDMNNQKSLIEQINQ